MLFVEFDASRDVQQFLHACLLVSHYQEDVGSAIGADLRLDQFDELAGENVVRELRELTHYFDFSDDAGGITVRKVIIPFNFLYSHQLISFKVYCLQYSTKGTTVYQLNEPVLGCNSCPTSIKVHGRTWLLEFHLWRFLLF